MKKAFLLMISGIAIMAAGCLKSESSSTPVPAPNGNFSGTFIRLYLNATHSGYDTLKKNFNVTLNSTGYRYKVTGDTSFHAGSHGSYAYDGTYIQFNDSTYAYVTASANANLRIKPHLSGIYQYVYDGTNFQLRQDYSSADTLIYYYSLKKQ